MRGALGEFITDKGIQTKMHEGTKLIRFPTTDVFRCFSGWLVMNPEINLVSRDILAIGRNNVQAGETIGRHTFGDHRIARFADFLRRLARPGLLGHYRHRHQ